MSTPAGWYPDPADPARSRWWDGAQWTQRTQDAALTTPTPAPPVPPVGNPAPPFGSPPPAAGAAGYAAAPTAYPSAPAVAYPSAPRQPGLRTDTVWVWLSIVVGLVPLAALFVIDWNGYIASTMAWDQPYGAMPTMAPGAWVLSTLGASLLSYAAIGASVLFAWLDWRELQRRGVVRPFHWAWAFFALVATIGVYIIGRTVILRRQTGGGMGPLWAWIASIVLTIVVVIAWLTWFLSALFSVLPTTPM
jgi:hypothetical protein